MNKTYYLQETIDGVKQPAIFGGSYKDCTMLFFATPGNYTIVPEDIYLKGLNIEL